MALEGRLELKLAQKLILTPQMHLAIKLLQMPQIELSQAIAQELIENPFLEEVMEEKEELSAEEAENAEYGKETDDSEAPLEKVMLHLSSQSVDEYFYNRESDGSDLGYFTPDKAEYPEHEQSSSINTDIHDYLLWQMQLSDVPENLRHVCETVIGNIDESGYLAATPEEIAACGSAGVEHVMEAIVIVQGFDPPGVAAADLKECILLQLRHLGLSGSLAEMIVRQNMEDIEKKRYQKIAKQYKLPMEDVMAAIKVIEGLEPRPGRNFSATATTYIAPDVFVIKHESDYQIILNDEGMPKIRINNFYKKMFSSKNSLPKDEKLFIEEKLRSAEWLLKSIDQRNRTIYRVTESILNFQRDFFDNGVSCLKPLNLRDVAENISMHESTISRVTSNKYLSCSHGLFSFRFLFSSALQGAGGAVSSTSVKDIIKKIISEENPLRPLSDQQIAELLKDKDVMVARRTVAKYREELKIMPQGQRKRQNFSPQ